MDDGGFGPKRWMKEKLWEGHHDGDRRLAMYDGGGDFGDSYGEYRELSDGHGGAPSSIFLSRDGQLGLRLGCNGRGSRGI